MTQGQLMREIEHFRRMLQFAYEGDSWFRLKSMDDTCESLLCTLEQCQVPTDQLSHIAAELNRMKVKFKPFLNRCPVHLSTQYVHQLPSKPVRLH